MRTGREKNHPHRRGRIDGTVLSASCEPTSIDYLRNMLVGSSIVRRAKTRLVDNLEEDEFVLAAMQAAAGRSVLKFRNDSEKLWAWLWRTIARSRQLPRTPAPLAEPICGNLRLLATLVGLSEMEAAALQFLVVQRLVKPLADLTDALGDLSLLGAADVLAAAIARPRDELLAVLTYKGRLASSGLMTIDDDPEPFQSKLIVQRSLVDIVLLPGLDRAQLLEHILPTASPPTLESDDYAHLAAEVALAQRLLGEALRARTSGINVLFYGATGTGKSELARLLARANGASLHVAGKEDEQGESSDAGERLSSLLLGNRLLASGSSLLLFDELEDLFERGSLVGLVGGERRDRAAPSKQWFNLLLETNPVPTIWISNDVWGIDPAFRRRFSYAIEFRPLGVVQRRRVWCRHLGTTTALSVGDVDRLAERFTISAGQIATAVGTARLVAGGEPDRAMIEQVAAPLEKLVRGVDPRPAHVVDEKGYLFEAANASCDLRALTDRLAPWRPGEGLGVSLCLYGPPGTGKSEFVHHLGRRMGRRVIVRRVSDILSMWVGEAERKIAEAFAEAERDGAVLLFDEADSFLRDRRGARNSWEVTQVNEFLQQLEAYRGIVACTTNLYRDIDQASLRRFVFKVEFGFINARQARLLYRSLLEPFLAEAPTPDEERQIERDLSRLANLTPGDFAAVARRMGVAGGCLGDGAPTTTILVEELRAEAMAKEYAARSIGF